MRWVFIAVFCLLGQRLWGTVDLYVATTGDDGNDGSIGSPFLTVGAARTALRSIDHTAQAANIWISGGRYLIAAEIDFTSSDSGASAAYPVTYRAVAGETPRFVGGKVVTGWAAVTNAALLARLSASAQTNVVVADLTANGVTPTALARYGFPIAFNGFAELFCNSTPGVIARYPTTGYLHFGAVSAVTNFVCSDSVPFTWTVDTNIMLAGFFEHDWKRVTEFAKLASPNVQMTRSGFAYVIVPGNRYFFENVFEALDTAGEYYFDRVNNLAYFWPPLPTNQCEVVVSQVANCFKTSSTSYITFEGLTFEGSTGSYFVLQAGTGISFTDCTFRNSCRSGLSATTSNPTSVTVSGCSFTDAGTFGVNTLSGIRTNLLSGNVLVTNSVFRRMGRIDPCYSAAVGFSGVSNTVINCTITDNPHAAVILDGNEHRVIGNLVSRVCTEVSDAGAIYAVGDWTYCGNIVANNVISDVTKQEAAMEFYVCGIYLDGSVSGNLMFSNTFVRVGNAMFNNGGKANTWHSNNTYYSSYYHAQVSQGSSALTNSLFTKLAAMPYASEPWVSRYPFLTNITYANAKEPTSSLITSNRYMVGTWLVVNNSADTLMTITNNIELIPSAINMTTLTVGP